MRDVEAVVSSWKKCWYERLSKQSCVRYHQCRTRCKKRSRPAAHNCTRRCASGRWTRHKNEIAQQDEDISELSRTIDKACPLRLNSLSRRQRTRSRTTLASGTAASRRRGRRGQSAPFVSLIGAQALDASCARRCYRRCCRSAISRARCRRHNVISRPLFVSA